MSGRILPVTAALLWRGQQFLLAQRLPDVDNGGKWELPGGKVEFGERPEACLARELAEELGLVATVGPLHGVFSHLAKPDLQVLLLVYHCHPGDVPPQAIECQAWRWVTVDEALHYDLAPLDRDIIAQLPK